jgi:hypothetical protein
MCIITQQPTKKGKHMINLETYHPDEYIAKMLSDHDWETITHYMDGDITTQLNCKIAPCDNRTFLDAYFAAHQDKYNELFEIN